MDHSACRARPKLELHIFGARVLSQKPHLTKLLWTWICFICFRSWQLAHHMVSFQKDLFHMMIWMPWMQLLDLKNPNWTAGPSYITTLLKYPSWVSRSHGRLKKSPIFNRKYIDSIRGPHVPASYVATWSVDSKIPCRSVTAQALSTLESLCPSDRKPTCLREGGERLHVNPPSEGMNQLVFYQENCKYVKITGTPSVETCLMSVIWGLDHPCDISSSSFCRKALPLKTSLLCTCHQNSRHLEPFYLVMLSI